MWLDGLIFGLSFKKFHYNNINSFSTNNRYELNKTNLLHDYDCYNCNCMHTDTKCQYQLFNMSTRVMYNKEKNSYHRLVLLKRLQLID